MAEEDLDDASHSQPRLIREVLPCAVATCAVEGRTFLVRTDPPVEGLAFDEDASEGIHPSLAFDRMDYSQGTRLVKRRIVAACTVAAVVVVAE